MGPQLCGGEEEIAHRATKKLQESCQARKKKKVQSRTSRSLPTIDEDLPETFDVEKNDLVHDEIEAKENVNAGKNDLTPEEKCNVDFDSETSGVLGSSSATHFAVAISL